MSMYHLQCDSGKTVEAVPDTNKHELAVVTAYKKKATEQQTRDAVSPTRTSETLLVSSSANNNTPQSGNVVKKSNAALAARLEAQSRNNEPIAVEDVKKATKGY